VRYHKALSTSYPSDDVPYIPVVYLRIAKLISRTLKAFGPFVPLRRHWLHTNWDIKTILYIK
jgi:hypothetical protein